MLKIVALLLVLSLQDVKSDSLHDDLLDLEQNVPMGRISQLFVQYIIQDSEFRRSLQYVRSAEFSDAWNQFLTIGKVHQLLSYMINAGLTVDKVLYMFAEFTGIEPPSVVFKRSIGKTGGLNAFVDDVIEAVALSQVKTITEEKKKLSPEFLQMTETMNSDEYKRLYAEALDDPEVRLLQEKLRIYGIEIPKLLDLMKAFFGWSAFF